MSFHFISFSRPLIVDVEDNQVVDVIKYYFTGGDTVTCRQLMQIDDKCDGYCLQDLVEIIKLHMPEDKDPLWMVRQLLVFGWKKC